MPVQMTLKAGCGAVNQMSSFEPVARSIATAALITILLLAGSGAAGAQSLQASLTPCSMLHVACRE